MGPTKGLELPGERMVPRGVRNFQDLAGYSQSIPAEQGFWYAHVVWAHDWHSKEGLPLLLYVPNAGGTQRPGAGTVQRHFHRMSAWLSLDGLHRPSCRGSSRRGSVTF